MRYVGQGWEIPIELDAGWCNAPDQGAITRLFEERYSQLFSRVVDGLDIEITSWTVLASTPIEPAPPAKPADSYQHVTSTRKRVMADLSDGSALDAAVYMRTSLAHGSLIKGPAIITEAETTILIPRGGVAIQHDDGTIDIRLDGNPNNDGDADHA
jgi:N-methylhydantoinase A